MGPFETLVETLTDADFEDGRRFFNSELEKLSGDELNQLRGKHPDSSVRKKAKQMLKRKGLPVEGPDYNDPHYRRPKKGGKIFTDPRDFNAMSDDDAEAIDGMVKALVRKGWKVNDKSKSGSVYLQSKKGTLMRIADHPPNPATKNWIRNNHVVDIRPEDDISPYLNESVGPFEQQVESLYNES